MEIVGPKTKLKHIKRISGDTTADGEELTWATPVRFEGIMTLLTGREVLTYQQMKVNVRYKVWTNYLGIEEEDIITRNSNEYDVKLIDDSLMMNKIAVILLDVKEE